VISFNINRKNNSLKFFEFGKTYSTSGPGNYTETNHLCLYVTGLQREQSWKEKEKASDIYYIKGVAEALLLNMGVKSGSFEMNQSNELNPSMVSRINGEKIVQLGRLSPALASRFDIKQPVFFADFYWDHILEHAAQKVQFREIAKYPSVERDLAMVVPQSMKYEAIQEQVAKLQLKNLKHIRLFDVFESEKLGSGKKSMAINLSFLDEEKTLTDKEIDGWMNKIMTTLEKELQAEIRK
jgi:phenylalanyl-tRNA synthetase beta chain